MPRSYSVIVSPPDKVEQEQLVFTLLTHAERGGLSVLRGRASDDEFVHVAKLRVQAGAAASEARVIFGVAEFTCAQIRSLTADQNAPDRNVGDRLFCVYDTDDDQLPSHADICQTWPRAVGKRKGEAARKRDRELLLRIYQSAKIINAQEFRGGILANVRL